MDDGSDRYRPQHHSRRTVPDADDNDEAVEAVWLYFAARFPPLLISVYHLAREHWPDAPAFRVFFHQTDEQSAQKQREQQW